MGRGGTRRHIANLAANKSWTTNNELLRRARRPLDHSPPHLELRTGSRRNAHKTLARPRARRRSALLPPSPTSLA
eukprot:6174441-Pleurochrysis_carterae.AAC.2